MANKIASRKYLHTMNPNIVNDGYCPPRSKIESYGGIKIVSMYAQNRLLTEFQCLKDSVTLTIKYPPLNVPDLLVTAGKMSFPLNEEPIDSTNFEAKISLSSQGWQEVYDMMVFDGYSNPDDSVITMAFSSKDKKWDHQYDFNRFDWSLDRLKSFSLGPALNKLINGQDTTITYPHATFRGKNGEAIGLDITTDYNHNKGNLLKLSTTFPHREEIIVPLVDTIFVNGKGFIDTGGGGIQILQSLVINESSSSSPSIIPKESYTYNSDGYNHSYNVSKYEGIGPNPDPNPDPDPNPGTGFTTQKISIMQMGNQIYNIDLYSVTVSFNEKSNITPKSITWNSTELTKGKFITFPKSDNNKFQQISYKVVIKDKRTGIVKPQIIVKVGGRALAPMSDSHIIGGIEYTGSSYFTTNGNNYRIDIEITTNQ